ncbi:MAG: adenylate/guanylate cyclase domain-containing protein [Pseudomonadota bacterium]
MSHKTLVSELGEWLIDQALDDPDMETMFDHVCQRLYSLGVPLSRARLTWPTLHPLFGAETVLWKRGESTVFEQFEHQDKETPSWDASPMKFMLDHEISVLRRRLTGDNQQLDFPILEDLMNEGDTDYVIISTEFITRAKLKSRNKSGLFVSWASDRPNGFSDDDIAALQKIQRRFSAACKTAIQSRIADNIVTTFLGPQAGKQVLDGAIRRGDGRETKAVVWYSDLRNSTALADTMPPEDYISMLNEYFECTAGPVVEAGGEVLDFIGDAVLAIFPFEGSDQLQDAARAASQALKNSLTQADALNAERKKKGEIPITFGVGLNTGRVMFGNIGVPQRLTFSVIGPTVNEVARIEAMTKAVESRALVTRAIASVEPDKWKSTGSHRLEGVAKQIELFAPSTEETTDIAGSTARSAEPEEAIFLN